jgi:hypothetical protein
MSPGNPGAGGLKVPAGTISAVVMVVLAMLTVLMSSHFNGLGAVATCGAATGLLVSWAGWLLHAVNPAANIKTDNVDNLMIIPPPSGEPVMIHINRKQ